VLHRSLLKLLLKIKDMLPNLPIAFKFLTSHQLMQWSKEMGTAGSKDWTLKRLLKYS